MIKNKFANPWKEFAQRWKKYYTPPGAPSPAFAALYKKYTLKAIKNKKNPKILILGATPELRQVMYNVKAEITIIDINIEMILAMTELVKNKRKDEIIVRGDWLSNPLADNYYDVVMGDLVIPNIPWNLQLNFLNKISNLLKKGGYFLSKDEFIPKDWVFEDFDRVLDKYKKYPFYRNEAVEIFVHLYSMVWDKKTRLVDTRKLKNGLNKYWKKDKYVHPNKAIEKSLNIIWTMFKPLEKVWAIGDEQGWTRNISRFFLIEEKIFLDDCKIKEFNKCFPFIVCKVKK